MTIQFIKSNKTMMCDDPKCTEFLESDDFMTLINDAKAANWLTIKDQKNKWIHYCPDCKPKSV